MSEKKELIFVGSGTEKFGGDLIEVTLNRNQLKEALTHPLTQDGHGFFEMNGIHYVKLSVQKMLKNLMARRVQSLLISSNLKIRKRS